MPRKPDTPCAVCGRLLWTGSTSLPSPVCRQCRSEQPRRQPDTRGTSEQQCEGCGLRYRPHRTSKASRFCSLSCAGRAGSNRPRKHLTLEARAEAARLKSERHDARRRARKYGVEYEPIDRRQVFIRDNWTCGICGGAVDPSLRWPARECATVDHIVPLARGGSHTYANTQCAHACCNIKKGANLTEADREASC